MSLHSDNNEVMTHPDPSGQNTCIFYTALTEQLICQIYGDNVQYARQGMVRW